MVCLLSTSYCLCRVSFFLYKQAQIRAGLVRPANYHEDNNDVIENNVDETTREYQKGGQRGVICFPKSLINSNVQGYWTLTNFESISV